MIEEYKKKAEAEIKKIEAEIKEIEKKWYQKPDIILKILIFLVGAGSLTLFSTLYNINNERLKLERAELKRDISKFKIEINQFQSKRDSLFTINSNLADFQNKLFDSIIVLHNDLNSLKNDLNNKNTEIFNLFKEFENIKNKQQAKKLENKLEKIVNPLRLKTTGNVTIENGTSVVLRATGNGTFLWSTGETTSSITVSPSKTTDYLVTLTNGKFLVEEDITVTVINKAKLANAGEDIYICKGEKAVLKAAGGNSYLWSTGETTASILVNPSETTVYTVTVSNNNAIDSDDVIVFVDKGCSGIRIRSTIKEISISPNPTDGLLNIELNGFNDPVNISIYSLNGNMIYSETIEDYSPDKVLKRQINVSRFGKGVYMIKVISKDGSSQTKKVLMI